MAPERPSPYRSRYLLYKKGSQQVVNWLYETASGLGPTKSLDKLKVIDLLSFARAISNANPKIELPPSIASTLSDVIYLRQQTHEWYSSLAREDGAAGDDRIGDINTSHRFFIDVLKRVKSTLEPVRVDATREQDQEQPNHPLFDISNMFSGLSLEESSDSPLGTAASPDASDNATIVENLEDERPFTIWCMFRDLHDIRLWVRRLWRQYYNGEITFPVAAYLTGMAFRVVSDIIIAAGDDSLRQYGGIVRALDLKIDHDLVRGIYGFSSAIDEGANGMEAADMFCVPGWCFLQDLLMSSRASRGLCSPRNEKVYLQGHPLGPALRGIQTQLHHLSKKSCSSGYAGPLHLDYFTINLLNVCRHHFIDTAAVVQCQMYMDIYDALGRQTDVVAEMLRTAASSLSKSIAEYLHAWECVPTYQEDMRDQVMQLLQLASVSLDDKISDAAVPDTCKPSSLFAVLPVLAGTYLYDLIRQASSFSIVCANHTIGTFGIAYLYSAMSDKPTWANMTRLLEQHKNYVLQASSLDMHSRNFEQAVAIQNSAHDRPASKGLSSSTASAQGLLYHTMHEQAIRFISEKLKATGRSDQFPGMLYEAVRLHRGKRFKSRPDSKSAVDLLSAFAEVLIDDEAKTSINYFCLAARCQTLLDSIIKDFTPRLGRMLAKSTGPSYQNIVQAILRERSSTTRSILDSLGPYFDRIIRMDEEDQTPGAFSGCIAEQDKPCNRWTWGGEDQPGYINGKKVFGPETPEDCMFRETLEKTRPIIAAGVQKWEAAQDMGLTGVLLERKLQEIESWGSQELLKVGLPATLKRIHNPGPGSCIGFQTEPIMEAFELANELGVSISEVVKWGQ